jgi:ABC-type polysaccharide/polyol phosphate transport system ATPase subunit
MDDLRKRIGMAFQGGALIGSLSVGENIALPLLEHTTFDRSTIEVMVRIKLEQVGLSGFEKYSPSQLSGGMRKRAAVARAMALDPEILFFDEPSAGNTQHFPCSTKVKGKGKGPPPRSLLPMPTSPVCSIPCISLSRTWSGRDCCRQSYTS